MFGYQTPSSMPCNTGETAFSMQFMKQTSKGQVQQDVDKCDDASSFQQSGCQNLSSLLKTIFQVKKKDSMALPTTQQSSTSFGDRLEEIIAMFDKDAFEPTPIRDFDSTTAYTSSTLVPSEESSSDSSTMNSSSSSTASYWNEEKIQHPAFQLDHHRHEAPQESNNNCDIVVSDILMPKSNANKKSLKKRDKKSLKVTKSQYSPKIRVYQKEKWWERYEELVKFLTVHGHSQVANTEHANRALARWVKRQRYQYRLSLERKPSSMTKVRINALEELNFVWDSHGAAWEDRLKELEAFKAKHRHCNVPSSYPANPSLASWVKCQRRQYRVFEAGEPTSITMERIVQLGKMGFQWSLRMPQRL
jgi:hypothetical protein